MNAKTAMLGITTNALVAVPAASDAHTRMRAVGSSTGYPFANMVAERGVRADLKLGTPIHQIDRLTHMDVRRGADATDLTSEVGGRD